MELFFFLSSSPFFRQHILITMDKLFCNSGWPPEYRGEFGVRVDASNKWCKSISNSVETEKEERERGEEAEKKKPHWLPDLKPGRL